MSRKAPKVAPHCDRCRQETPARYRAIFDAYLCIECYHDRLEGAPEVVPMPELLEWSV